MSDSIFTGDSPTLIRAQRLLRTLGLMALIALALTPLVMDPAAHDDAYMAPKWAWIGLWTTLGLTALAGRMATGRPLTFPMDGVWVSALLFALWHWIAIAWAPSRSLGIDRALRVTLLTAAMGLGINLLRGRRALIRLAWAWLAVATITALWVLIEDCVRRWWPAQVWIRPNLPDWRGYLAAGLGNTNHLGDLLALAILPAMTLYGEARKTAVRTILFSMLMLFVAALIVCFSVGSNLGLILGGLLMTGLMIARGRGRWFARRWRRWLALALGWAAVICFLNTNQPLNPHAPGILRQGFASGRWVEGGPTRLAIWAQTLEMIRLHPLRGVGAGNFTYVFPEMDSRLVADRSDLLAYQGLWTNAAHNDLLQAWAELGIGGLFLFMTLLALALHSLLHRIGEAGRLNFLARVTLAGMLAAWAGHAQMNFALEHPAGLLSLFGLLMAVAIERRARAGRRPMPPLLWESGPLAIQVEWRTMSRPTGVGLALVAPSWLGMTLAAGLVALWFVFAPDFFSRPVRAQREYHRAALARAPIAAEAHFLNALEIDPHLSDCRSRYSQWLLEQGRAEDCLYQLQIVRERLNSNELWLRQAQALEKLGRKDDAEQALKHFFDKVWKARQTMR